MRYGLLLSALMLPLSAMADGGIMEQVFANNPDLQSAKMTYEADALNFRAENNLADPEVELAYLFDRPGKSIELSVTEGIDWPGVYGARKKYIKHQITALEYVYQTKCVEISSQVRLALADLVNVNRRIALQKRVLAEEENLLDLLSEKYADREISIIEMNKLRLELFDNKVALKDLNVQKNVIIESLKALNGGKELSGLDTDAVEYSGGILEPVDFYISDFRQYSPEYKVAIQQQIVGAQAEKVAKLSNFPGFTVGYKYKDEGGEQAHGFIVGMSIPIFSGRHKLSAAKSRSLADSYAADNTGLQEELRVRSGYAALLSQEEMIGKYKPLVENEDYYRILSEALNGGQISLRDYIIEIRDIAEATQKLYDMEYSFQTGYVDLTKYDVLKDVGNLF